MSFKEKKKPEHDLQKEKKKPEHDLQKEKIREKLSLLTKEMPQVTYKALKRKLEEATEAGFEEFTGTKASQKNKCDAIIDGLVANVVKDINSEDSDEKIENPSVGSSEKNKGDFKTKLFGTTKTK